MHQHVYGHAADGTAIDRGSQACDMW